jgi:hypothetical protein
MGRNDDPNFLVGQISLAGAGIAFSSGATLGAGDSIGVMHRLWF